MTNIEPLSEYREVEVYRTLYDDAGNECDVYVDHDQQAILIDHSLPPQAREIAISEARQKAASARYQKRPSVRAV